jgi:hypothetical protein
MFNAILDSPLIKHPKPWWQPFLSLLLTLYGITVLGWNLQPIVFIFWWELILMAAAALLRGFSALDGQPFFNNFFQRVFALFGGMFMFGAMIMLAVTFSFKIFDNGFNSEGFDKIPRQVNLLIAGYVLGLVFHFFANGRYKTASPMGEVMQTMIHFLILLVFLMVLTMHLIPAFPQLDQAKWVGVAVVVVKFVVDYIFSKVQKPIEKLKAEL